MTAECALWVFQTGCFGGELATGSLPEWMTAIVTVLALAAAVYAGIAATSAAKSAREQSIAAASALVSAQEQASSAAAAVLYARDQAQAAMDSVKHSESAAASARDQAVAAQNAFEADAKVREEAQARQVYSTLMARQWLEPGVPIDGGDISVVYDVGYLSNPQMDVSGRVLQETKRYGLQLFVTVFNQSSEIIGAVAIQAGHAYGNRQSVQGVYEQPIEPGGTFGCTLVVPMDEGFDPDGTTPDEQALGWVATIEYRDSVGVWWSRRGSSYIVKLDRGPDELP